MASGAERRKRQRERTESATFRSWASAIYLQALERANKRRRELGLEQMPTHPVAVGERELELLLHELDRPRPFLARRRDPALEPLIAELRALHAAARLATTDTDEGSNDR